MSSSSPDNPGLRGVAAPTITGRMLILMAIAAALFTIFSIGVIDYITHNFYASSYYTFAALFDTNPSTSGGIIASLIPPFSSSFYALLAISALDGVIKAVIIGFIIATFTKSIMSIDISSKINAAAAIRLKNHVIVCGYSMLAERLCKELKREGVQFVVIDKNPEIVGLLGELGYRAVNGDFTEARTLNAAMLRASKAIVFATESDFNNLLGVVTAKHAYPNAKIITRTSEEINIGKMKRGGAKLCLVPEIVAGQELGDSILKL